MFSRQLTVKYLSRNSERARTCQGAILRECGLENFRIVLCSHLSSLEVSICDCGAPWIVVDGGCPVFGAQPRDSGFGFVTGDYETSLLCGIWRRRMKRAEDHG